MIGAVSIHHPNVLSGKWVHHSKGRVQSDKEIEFKKIHNLGQGNPNHSGLSDEYFIRKGIEMFEEFGEILSWTQMARLAQERDFKWILSLRSRFNGNGLKGYYSILENKLGVKYCE
jgi:hypothetical protein